MGKLRTLLHGEITGSFRLTISHPNFRQPDCRDLVPQRNPGPPTSLSSIHLFTLRFTFRLSDRDFTQPPFTVSALTMMDDDADWQKVDDADWQIVDDADWQKVDGADWPEVDIARVGFFYKRKQGINTEYVRILGDEDLRNALADMGWDMSEKTYVVLHLRPLAGSFA